MALVEVNNVRKDFGKVNVLGGINLNLQEEREYVKETHHSYEDDGS